VHAPTPLRSQNPRRVFFTGVFSSSKGIDHDNLANSARLSTCSLLIAVPHVVLSLILYTRHIAYIISSPLRKSWLSIPHRRFIMLVSRTTEETEFASPRPIDHSSARDCDEGDMEGQVDASQQLEPRHQRLERTVAATIAQHFRQSNTDNTNIEAYQLPSRQGRQSVRIAFQRHNGQLLLHCLVVNAAETEAEVIAKVPGLWKSAIGSNAFWHTFRRMLFTLVLETGTLTGVSYPLVFHSSPHVLLPSAAVLYMLLTDHPLVLRARLRDYTIPLPRLRNRSSPQPAVDRRHERWLRVQPRRRRDRGGFRDESQQPSLHVEHAQGSYSCTQSPQRGFMRHRGAGHYSCRRCWRHGLGVYRS
jgi:hypothetical protein